MSKNIQIYVHVFDSENEIYEKLFTKECEKMTKEYGIVEKRSMNYKANKSIIFNIFASEKTWEGYKYPKLSRQNLNAILKDIKNSIKTNENKNHIFIKFGNEFIKEFKNFINSFDIDCPFLLYVLEKENDISKFIFKKPQNIAYLIESEKDEQNLLLINKITTYILEKVCYFNEEGNDLYKHFPANVLYKEPKGFLYLNILLTGESRAGKSSFINRIFKKLVSYESPKMESSTRKINFYELYPKEEENSNLLKRGFGGIKIFDTPGLVKTKDLDSFELIKNQLENFFNEIHIIYFFTKAQSNLEQCIDMLKYVKQKNKERKEKNLKNIPIIFIKNGEDLIKDVKNPLFFEELKKILNKKENDLSELYDCTINKNNDIDEIDQEENFFEDEDDKVEGYDNYVDGNMIQIHIPTGKNIHKIFSTTKEYIIQNNTNLINDDIFKLKDDAKKLIKFYIKEKLEKESLTKYEEKELNRKYEECNKYVIDYKNKCSIFYNLDELNVKSKAKFWIGAIGSHITHMFSSFILPIIPFIFLFRLYKKNCINNLAIKFGFGEKEIYEYELDKYVYKKEICDEKDFEKKIQELFKDLIYYIGPIQCLIKAKEMYNQILDLLTELGKRSELSWNDYKVEKI